GIYDPHLAQVSAHTVVRMVQLMSGLEKQDPDYDLKMGICLLILPDSIQFIKITTRRVAATNTIAPDSIAI
ncbi:MAG: hypothetical protein HeimC2_44400, partial [Candidatus Heimdallarchaeota archaeon LC_2]